MGRTSRASARVGSGVVTVAALAVVGVAPAAAQSRRPIPQAQSGGITVHRDPAVEPIALARIRLAKGDFVGALEAFDIALRTSIDVTARRDRGVCHERLGHPFPAIDDYRAYLTALPDAPDSEEVRTRLNQLEVANGFGGTGTGGSTGGAEQTARHEDPFAVDPAKPAGTNEMASPAAAPRTGDYDQEVATSERWDEAESSPLRRGSGLSFGAFGRGYASTQAGLTGYGVGATIRGSIGKWNTIYGEVGYVKYVASAGGVSLGFGGPALGLGYEFRIRLDELATHAIILAVALSYERITLPTQTIGGLTLGGISGNVLDPRAKLGYRFVLGPGFGIEAAAEAGAPFGVVNGSPSFATLGGTVALLVGF